jgi:hypothetical protein
MQEISLLAEKLSASHDRFSSMELLCKYFTTMGPLLDVTMLSHGSEWALPSGNTFCNPVFRTLEQSACGTHFQKSPYPPMLHSGCNMHRNAVCGGTLKDSGFLPLSITGSFTCHLCIHFHNTIASKSSLYNFCCTLKCKAFLVKTKLTDIHCIPDITARFLPVSFLLSAAASLTSSFSSCTAMSQVMSHFLNMVSH